MEQFEGIGWGVENGIGRIVLQRPEKANAISPAFAPAMARAIDGVLAAAPRVVLLTATGPVFCAGGDIQAFVAAGPGLPAMVDSMILPLHPAILRLARAPVPVVSVIGGAVGGAGIGLALCADFVLAARSMKLRTGYSAIGLSPDLGTSYFLARRIGAQKAKQWLMLSDAIDAQRCLEAGAVDSLHAPDELRPAAEALAQRLAGSARESLAAIKLLCDGMPARDLAAHLALEHELLLARTRGPDVREGISAFLEKRPPRFQE
jgi:2-(1,2-epoxy-1,2-dihydrophenyl)acetyl-CoA isomerase